MDTASRDDRARCRVDELVTRSSLASSGGACSPGVRRKQSRPAGCVGDRGLHDREHLRRVPVLPAASAVATILLLVELERRSDPPSCPAHRLERRAKVETPPPGCRRAGIVARSDACEPSRAIPVPLSFGRYALPSGPDGCSSIAAQRQLGGGGFPRTGWSTRRAPPVERWSTSSATVKPWRPLGGDRDGRIRAGDDAPRVPNSGALPAHAAEEDDLQIGPLRVGADNDRTGQVGTAQVGAAEVDLGQDGVAQVDTCEVGTGEVQGRPSSRAPPLHQRGRGVRRRAGAGVGRQGERFRGVVTSAELYPSTALWQIPWIRHGCRRRMPTCRDPGSTSRSRGGVRRCSAAR